MTGRTAWIKAGSRTDPTGAWAVLPLSDTRQVCIRRRFRVSPDRAGWAGVSLPTALMSNDLSGSSVGTSGPAGPTQVNADGLWRCRPRSGCFVAVRQRGVEEALNAGDHRACPPCGEQIEGMLGIGQLEGHDVRAGRRSQRRDKGTSIFDARERIVDAVHHRERGASGCTRQIGDACRTRRRVSDPLLHHDPLQEPAHAVATDSSGAVRKVVDAVERGACLHRGVGRLEAGLVLRLVRCEGSKSCKVRARGATGDCDEAAVGSEFSCVRPHPGQHPLDIHEMVGERRAWASR